MNDVGVVYRGPMGAYQVEDDQGAWHQLVRGTATIIPESLAEKLLALEDHDVVRSEDIEAEVSHDPEPPYEISFVGGSANGETGTTDSLDPIPDAEDGEYRFAKFHEDVAVFEWHEEGDPQGVKPNDPQDGGS